MDLVPRITSIAAAYLLGGCMPGYWFVRWRTGIDVRAQGSGRTGATNAGRVLGRAGFAAVLAVDLAKGALAVLLARTLDPGTEWIAGAAVAVIVGHVWPAWLGFRGGRGLGPLGGAWAVLAPWASIVAATLAAVALLVTRRRGPAAAVGLCLLPLAVFLECSGTTAIAAALGSVVVLYAHRDLFGSRTSCAAEAPR